MKKNKTDLIKFLKFREKLHGRIITSDELEICGAFLSNLIDKENLESDKTLMLAPDNMNIFDITYQKEGLGFKNEKNLNIKRSGKFLPIGGF